jgi:hypothetical protein
LASDVFVLRIKSNYECKDMCIYKIEGKQNNAKAATKEKVKEQRHI